jgi:predicted metal-dependent phosphoesterase TrpH
MRERKVRFLSITDHDTVGAHGDFVAADLGGARLVTGIEMNSTYKGNEVHVLGYRIDLESPELTALIVRNKGSRRRRMETMVRQLQAAGYALTVDQVLAEATAEASLGRPHVAKALVRSGALTDVKTAFKSLLVRGGAGYVPSLYVTPQQAIEVIARAGGISVLAHPGRINDRAIIDELAESGLGGLEVYHPSHDSGRREAFRQKAAALGLVVTAGSDFHDMRVNPEGVGMEVEEAVIKPFLDLVL